MIPVPDADVRRNSESSWHAWVQRFISNAIARRDGFDFRNLLLPCSRLFAPLRAVLPRERDVIPMIMPDIFKIRLALPVHTVARVSIYRR